MIYPGIPRGIPGRRDPLGLPEGEGYEPRPPRLTPFLGPGYPWGLVRCNGGFKEEVSNPPSQKATREGISFYAPPSHSLNQKLTSDHSTFDGPATLKESSTAW